MSGYSGFQFNGKRLSDFGCFVAKRETPTPGKAQITETIPYMSGSYDFSALYGAPCYNDRTIKYMVDLVGADLIDLAAQKQQLQNWLLPCHRSQLIDDSMPDWYFLAECISVIPSDDKILSELTIEFAASPFKFSVNLQTASYAPSAAADVVANNAGTVTVTPTITCAAAATVVYGGNTYTLGIGAHTSYTFALAPGNNTFNITSTGAVTIAWRTEVL